MEELEKNETSTQVEENTVSLASAQALADALAKIEAYTPTTWVDNSSPDIDAEHLNKPEQAIKRVTDALNSAVDVIKDLQSQVTKNAGDISTVNNNLSKKLFVKIGDTSNGNHSQIDQIADFYGITWVNSNYNSTFGGQWCFVDSTIIDNSGPYAMQRIMSCENAAILATRYCTKGTWGAWNVGVTKSDLSDRAKKLSANFTPGNTVLDVSSWSVITLLSIVTYKEESTALYLLRKESSSKIYCIPVKSSTQVSVTYNGENKLILTNSATYGGTYTVLFLS